MRTMHFVIATIVCVFCIACHAELSAADFDVISRKDRKKIECTIVNETMDAVVYIAKRGTSEIKLRWKDVRRITYKGMATKRWQQAEAALKNGDYETAARLFSQTAGGEEVWAQAYGAYNQAIALEKNGQHAEAVEALTPMIKKLPEHRMAMYALFRQGVNAALSEGGDVATPLAALKAWNMDAVGSDMEKALVVLQLMAKDFKQAKAKARSLRKRFKSDLKTQLYWNILWNGILLKRDSKPDDAIRGLEGLYKSMAKRPVLRAELSVVLAEALVQANRADEALYYFLHVNSMPFVGVKMQADARFAAAKILIARLAVREDSADKKQTEKMRQRSKALLSAVVKYGKDDEQALAAQTLLDETFPTEAKEVKVEKEEKKDEKEVKAEK